MKYLILILFSFSICATAQTTWDFETTAQDTGWTVFSSTAEQFSVVPNPSVSGLNLTAHAAKLVISQTADPWAGVFNTNVPPFVVTSQNCKPTLLVYKDTTSRVDFKYEGVGWNSGDTFDSNTVANQWVTVSYDFSAYIGKTVTTITIIPDFATANPRNYSSVNYFDLITFVPTVVPVELTSFTALSEGGNVKLKWNSSSEINNSGFEIQRSNNNVNFSKIGYIQGHGSTTKSYEYTFVDNSAFGHQYYRLKQVDFNGSYNYSKVVEVTIDKPLGFTLNQNYPNPFNPSTIISYSIPEKSFVTIKVYDVIGNEVATLINNQMEAGEHSVKFNGSNLSSGIYYYQIKDGNNIATKKLMLLK